MVGLSFFASFLLIHDMYIIWFLFSISDSAIKSATDIILLAVSGSMHGTLCGIYVFLLLSHGTLPTTEWIHKMKMNYDFRALNIICLLFFLYFFLSIYYFMSCLQFLILSPAKRLNNRNEINKQTIPFGIWSGKTTLISLSLIYLIVVFFFLSSFAICRWCSWKNGHQIEIFNSFRWFKIRKNRKEFHHFFILNSCNLLNAVRWIIFNWSHERERA